MVLTKCWKAIDEGYKNDHILDKFFDNHDALKFWT